MVKTVTDYNTDLGGNTTVEYSDGSTNSFNITDAVTAKTDPVTGGIEYSIATTGAVLVDWFKAAFPADADAFEAACAVASVRSADVCSTIPLIFLRSVTVPVGVTVCGVKVTMSGGNWLIDLNQDAKLIGCSVSSPSSGFAPAVRMMYGKSGIHVDRCKILGGIGIHANGSNNVWITENEIECKNGYAVYADGNLKTSQISKNRVVCDGVAYGIYLQYEGVDNHISGNIVTAKTSNAVAGILLHGSGQGVFSGNSIDGNIVSGFAEEGISVDNNTGSDIRTVSNKYPSSGGADILVYSGVSLAVGALSGKVMSVVIGASAGNGLKIVSGYGGNDIYFPVGSLGAITVGDTIALGNIALDNSITNNTVSKCGREGIMLYGSIVGSTVSGNTVSHCGIATPMEMFAGHAAYEFCGISALTNTSVVESPNMGCKITDNRVRNCYRGIQVGAAYWDFVATKKPKGCIVRDNDIKGCGTKYLVDAEVTGTLELTMG